MTVMEATRKKHTGEPGNGGQFGSKANTESDVGLVARHSELRANRERMMVEQRRKQMERENWEPEYEAWNFRGSLVRNVVFPDGSAGRIGSKNYTISGKYESDRFNLGSFETRDEAARAERELAIRLWREIDEDKAASYPEYDYTKRLYRDEVFEGQDRTMTRAEWFAVFPENDIDNPILKAFREDDEDGNSPAMYLDILDDNPADFWPDATQGDIDEARAALSRRPV